MLRYLLAGHASVPPVDARFILSSSVKLVTLVLRRVMPVVGFPEGSLSASANSMRASAAMLLDGAGILLRSEFFLRKSRLSTSIWLLICASEMFWAAVLWTTCT